MVNYKKKKGLEFPEMRLGLLIVMFFLVLLASASAVGYAPIMVQGTVIGQEQLTSADVWMKAYQEGEEIARSDSMPLNAQGQFYQAISVPDGFTGDIQITIVTDGETYVELLEEVSAWQDYEITIDLASDELGVAATRSSGGSPFNPGFDEDLEAIVQGEASPETIDAYDLEEIDSPIPAGPLIYDAQRLAAVEEQPAVTRRIIAESGEADGGWLGKELLASVGIVALLALLVYLLSRRQ